MSKTDLIKWQNNQWWQAENLLPTIASKSQPGLDFVLLKDKLCIFVYDGSVPPLTDVSESEYQNTRSIWILTQNAICVMGPWFMVSWRDGRLTSLCNIALHSAIIFLAGTGQTVQLCCVCLNKGCCWLCCWVGVFYAKFDNIQCLLFSVMRSGAGPAAAGGAGGLSDFDQLRARICRSQDLEVIVLSSTTHLHRSFLLMGPSKILWQISHYTCIDFATFCSLIYFFSLIFMKNKRFR